MAGKVTIGLATHWPCITDLSGLSTDGLSGLQEGDEQHAHTSLRSLAPLFTVHGRLIQYHTN